MVSKTNLVWVLFLANVVSVCLGGLGPGPIPQYSPTPTDSPPVQQPIVNPFVPPTENLDGLILRLLGFRYDT